MNRTLVLIVIIAALVLSSCNKDPWADDREKEQTEIDEYILNLQSTHPEYTIEQINGIYFISLEKNESAPKPVLDDYVIVDFLGKDLKGKIIETNIFSFKGDWDKADVFENFIYSPLKMRFGYSIPGINNGLSLMHEGDSAIFIIPSYQSFNDFRPLEYTLKLHKIITDIIKYDSIQVDTTLKQSSMNKLNNYIADAGIYYKEVVSPLVEEVALDSFTLIYSAYYIQEDNLILFDASKTEGVAMSKQNITSPSAIPFTEGLVQAFDTLTYGTSALIIVPYPHAFKETGYNHSIFKYTIVPNYTSLLYSVRIMDKE